MIAVMADIWTPAVGEALKWMRAEGEEVEFISRAVLDMGDVATNVAALETLKDAKRIIYLNRDGEVVA